MLVSTKGRYALKLMVRVALAPEGVPVSLREVAQVEDISVKYLEQLVRPLMQAHLLRGLRGKGGGYLLEKDPADISAGDVLRAAEGTTAPVACMGLTETEGCPNWCACTTMNFWVGLDEIIERYVDGVTLADLVHQEMDAANTVAQAMVAAVDIQESSQD